MKMSVKAKKILCAVSHANQEPWIDIWKNGQLETWQKWEDTEEFTIINFFGRKPNLCTRSLDNFHEKIRWSNKYAAKIQMHIDRVLLKPFIFIEPYFKVNVDLTGKHSAYEVGFCDSFLTYRWKILTLIQHFLEQTEFDFLYVTSSSSYVRPKILLEFVSTLSDTKVYLGALPYNGAEFVSGSSRLISRDVAMLIWSNRRKFDFALIEDKAMAALLLSLGITPTFIPLTNINSVNDAQQLKIQEFSQVYHFRLKSFADGCRSDVAVMRALHVKFADEFSNA